MWLSLVEGPGPSFGLVEPNLGLIGPGLSLVEPNLGLIGHGFSRVEPNFRFLMPGLGLFGPKTQSQAFFAYSRAHEMLRTS